MMFELKKILYKDWKLLLKWRNDKNTRTWFFNDSIVTEDNHKKYINTILNNKDTIQYMLYINNHPCGTIKSIKKNDEYYLSYSIDKNYRGKGLSIIMMHLFLYDKKGTFICEIKKNNIPSCKMVKKIGYELYEQSNNILKYKLIK
tara:strand:- start:474 stop:908 length:435 start_codon:yes stop_codon:yes gene_type:complete